METLKTNTKVKFFQATSLNRFRLASSHSYDYVQGGNKAQEIKRREVVFAILLPRYTLHRSHYFSLVIPIYPSPQHHLLRGQQLIFSALFLQFVFQNELYKVNNLGVLRKFSLQYHFLDPTDVFPQLFFTESHQAGQFLTAITESHTFSWSALMCQCKTNLNFIGTCSISQSLAEFLRTYLVIITR